MLGIYIRKSVEREKEKSIKEQILLGQEFALENKMKYKMFNEGIISGQKKKEQRPKFAELYKAIENKEISCVYIWDSSRIARNEKAWLDFAELLRDTGTLLYDNGVEADFSNENTFLFYYMKSGFDAHFAKLTAKKIQTVLKRNAMEGKPHGIAPYGYTTDENGKWKIHEDEVETVKTIFNLYQKGYGYIRIANHLNEMGVPTRYEIIWTPATIRYMIYNKTYSGRAKHNELEIKVPAIIDKNTHDKLLDSIKNRYKKPGAKSKKYILNEVMVCGKCGTRYTISQRHRNSYYRCLSEVNRGVPKCQSRAMKAEYMDKIVLEHILFGRELYELAHQTYLEGGNVEQKRLLKTKINVQNKKLSELISKFKRNHADYISIKNLTQLDIETYYEAKKDINTKMFKAEESIKMLSDELEKLEDTDRLLEQMKIDFDINLPEVWKDETDPTMKAWKEHAIREAIISNRIDRNREKIMETATFEEKCAMVEKYIKQISIYGKQIPVRIKVEFNIPVPPMELLIESRYYGAKNLTTNKNHYFRDFGKQPRVIYQRMQEEFDKYTNGL